MPCLLRDWLIRASVLYMALGCLISVNGFYIPGTYPKEFYEGETIRAEVNSVTSFGTELPYDYYSLPFCKPKGGIKKSTSSVSPGTILSGLRMFNSPYELRINEFEMAKEVCKDGSAGALTKKQVKDLKEKIDKRYRIRMVLDNMPITTYDLEKGQTHLRPGFELGTMNGHDYVIFNHLAFNILIHRTHGEYTKIAKTNAMTGAYIIDPANRRLLRYEEDSVSGRTLAWPEDTPGAVVDALRARSASTGRHLLDEKEAGADTKPAKKKAEGGQTEAATSGINSNTPPLVCIFPVFVTLQQAMLYAGLCAGMVVSIPLVEAETMWMVVGFEVMPCSIKRVKGEPLETIPCKPWGAPDNPEPQVVAEGEDIVYTYDVYWQESDVEWRSRWDLYLGMPNGAAHWVSIVSSLLVVLVMSVIVAVILTRTVRRDLAKCEELLVEGQDAKEESGGKLSSGDVFRAPSSAADLSVQVGTGAQIFCTAVVTLLLAVTGFLSPASRGALLTSTIFLYLLLAMPAGYAAVWLWCNTQRTAAGWTSICLKTACYFPGITLAACTIYNITVASTGTRSAVPFTMYFSIMAFWFFVSVPLMYIGGYMAARTPLVTWPTPANQIPRLVPPPTAASNPYVLYAASGILPFCAIFIELYFVMTSMWQGYFYYLFGFLSIAIGFTVLITIEVAILCTYKQLCGGDYNWWWRSFHHGGAPAAFLLLYAIRFFFTHQLGMHGLSVLLYVCYMAIAILATHLCLGAVGFAASLAFVRLAYSRLEATGRGGKGTSEEGEQLLPGHAAAAAEKQGAGEGDAQAGSAPV